MATTVTALERPVAVDNEGEPTRGQRIQDRRRALGLWKRSQFAEASGLNYDTLGRVEANNASEATFAEVEAWLDRMEAAGKQPQETAPGGSAVRVQMHDVFGIGEVEVIFEGDTSPEELAAKMRALVEGLKPRSGPVVVDGNDS